MWFVWLSLLALGLLDGSNGAKILAIFPFSQTSHQLIAKPLILELSQRGHLVTYVSPYKYKETNPNLEEIIMPDLWAKFESTVIKGKPEPNSRDDTFVHAIMFNAMVGLANATLRSKEVTEILTSNRQYDAVITESFFFQEWAAVFAHRFKALRIVINSFGGSPWINELSGLPDNPSYMKDNKFFKPGPPETFYERLLNTYQTSRMIVCGYYYITGPMQQLIDELVRYPGWETRPRLSMMVADNALILLNAHISLADPVPAAPHVKHIGGINVDFHLDKKPKQLDQPKYLEYKKFMDDSKNGFLFFSLGSVVKPDKMLPPGTFQILYRAFSKLKINVVMRWTGLEMPASLAPNIKLTKEFLPQMDILAHKNIKAFLTHGGLLSVTESIYFGVPIIGFPVFADQPMNARKAAYRGYGVFLEVNGNLTDTSISWAVNEILSNPSYKKEALRRSTLLKDRVMTPAEEAAYWTEYVLKYGNVLQPAAVHKPLYQIFLLDLIGFIFGVTLVFIYLCFRVIRTIRQFCQSKNKTSTSKRVHTRSTRKKDD